MYKIPANTLFLGQKMIYVPECHSTNSLLGELNNQTELPEGTVLITNHQTAGRGQRGNRWESNPAENLTFSILLKPKFLNTTDQFQLNIAVAVGVADGLAGLAPHPIALKWPNDIFADDKKIGGVLIECQSQGNSLSLSIVGIGININQKSFSHPNAASLSNLSGLNYDLNNVLGRVIKSIEVAYLDLRAGAISILKNRYLNQLYTYRQLRSFEAGTHKFSGSIVDVDEQGRLCIESEGEVRKFLFKEVRMM